MSPEYQKALEDNSKVIGIFAKVQDAYRALKCDDETYLKARKAYDEAMKVFDEAYKKESEIS